MRTTLIAMLLTSNVIACAPGCFPYDGICACDEKPKDTIPMPEVKPSDDKPSRHPEPAYERGEVNAQLPTSLEQDDLKRDQESLDAIAQGKKAAGIK